MTVQEMRERRRNWGIPILRLRSCPECLWAPCRKCLAELPSTPRYETLMALEQVLGESEGMFLREPKSAYLTKSQGDYTLDDYYLIPDDMRVELIDGVIYDMTAPTSAHPADRRIYLQ